jgi:hypothetical protein
MLQDIGARAADFAHLSGRYKLTLLIGDAVLSNSFSWEVADVSLTFASTGSQEATPSEVPDVYKPKSEIKVSIINFIYILSNNRTLNC